MAIARNDTFCPGCRAKIRLRLGVGRSPHQPFYFVCKQCTAPAKGEMVFDDEWNGELFIEGSAAEIDSHDEPDQTITIHSDLPAIVDATEMWEEGGSPFLLQRQLMSDENMQAWMGRLNLFQNASIGGASEFKRLSHYYAK